MTPNLKGLPKKTDPGSSDTRIAVIFLQPQCNMTCLFCATENNFQSLTLDQGQFMVKALRAEGISNIIFGGGEPFAWRPGPIQLARFAKSLGMFVQIGTNGVSLPSGFATSRWVDRYILPMDSSETKAHDMLRIHEGGHHRVILERLESLGRAQKAVTISTVVTRANMGQLGDLGRYLSEYHHKYGTLHAWHLYRMLSIGRGGAKNGPRLDVGEAEYNRVCDQVRTQQPNIQILKRPDMRKSSTVGFFWMQDGAYRSMSPFKVDFQ